MSSVFDGLKKAMEYERTPADLIDAVDVIDRLIDLHHQQTENFQRLRRVVYWLVFQPHHFPKGMAGGLSTQVVGNFRSFDGVEVKVVFPDKYQHSFKLSEMPIECWPTERMPASFQPRMKGERMGPCGSPGCKLMPAIWQVDGDDLYYCMKCGKQMEGHKSEGPKKVERSRTIASDPGFGMDGMSIQRQMHRVGIFNLKEYVERTKAILGD